MSDRLQVVIAPDSYKGSMSADIAANAIARGWAATRPGDTVMCYPQADGGEGTAEIIARAVAGARWCSVSDVPGPDGRLRDSSWLRLPDGTGVIELAHMSGITLMERLDPRAASTRGFGMVIDAALREGVTSLILCLGGSASNDGGAGVLRALGADLLDGHGDTVPDGAEGLLSLASVDLDHVPSAPPGGVTLLTDVTAPLLGPSGATAVFGPQKGIAPATAERFERGLQNLARELRSDPSRPGMGAAGGTAFGLASIWDLDIVPGAEYVADKTGLTRALDDADILITGEGRFDSQSSSGKVVGTLAALASEKGLPLAIIAGSVQSGHDGATVDLTRIAGSAAAAMSDPEHFAELAGAALANHMSDQSTHEKRDQTQPQ
ncbi:glycerate kinase [Phytoactinopolyspora halotolerans]|uniref:glycerate kinase n=1 Tax=Phytoactinopolyspora halotolerans TaxID=1981512 RepID=UPI001C203107|nr:glycerate kinase [Phytoactinopolyspora halotolerans]